MVTEKLKNGYWKIKKITARLKNETWTNPQITNHKESHELGGGGRCLRFV